MTRRFAAAVALGSGLGAFMLGAGGRIAMRILAVRQQRPPALTWSGTLTVIIVGAILGVIGGLVLLVLLRLLPSRPWLRRTLFVVVCLVTAAIFFWPLRSDVTSLFGGVALAYSLALQALWGPLVEGERSK